MATGYALLSSLIWGTADALAAVSARRIGSVHAAFWVQALGLALGAAWVAAVAAPLPPATAVFHAAVAGVALTAALLAFFQALVVGKIAIVTPISATGVAIPVLVGLAQGDQLSLVQAVGVMTAGTGVFLAARPPGASLRRAGSALALALTAAVGWGAYLCLLAPAADYGVAWANTISRIVPFFGLSAVVASRTMRSRQGFAGSTAIIVLGTAVGAFGGTLLYTLAVVHGQLAVVSVLASVYPAVTVLIATRVFGERLAATQSAGVAAIIAGVVLLSV